MANQIALSEAYQKDIKEHGLPVGKFLSIEAAEWFQGRVVFSSLLQGIVNVLDSPGLPTGWSSDRPGAVGPSALKAGFNEVGLPDGLLVRCVFVLI